LRTLSRKFPPPPEVEKILATLHQQNDRSIAIVSAALLEAALEKLIIKKLPYSNPRLEGRLFKNRGPLSDFDSKVLIAVAFGIITDGLAIRFDSIRVIRNVFSHSTVDVSFETKEIADELKSHLVPYVLKAIEVITDKAPTEQPTNKRVFCIAVRVICFLLDDTHEELTGSRLFSQLT
jgi:DNA-binding MltR family transcriptional regulator